MEIIYIYCVIIIVAIYLFDAIVTQYIAGSKATKLRRLEKSDEHFICPDWHTSPKGQTISTIVFWILGILFAIAIPNHLGYYVSTVVVYCYGALPWMYYYHVNFMTTKLFYKYKRGNDDIGNMGCLLIFLNVLWVFIKPIICYVYALIFYIKDFITKKGS